MSSDNFEKALRGFCKRSRFLPFTVELVSGLTIVVTHPESLTFRNGLAVLIRPDGGYFLFDNESVCHVADQKLPNPNEND